MRLLILFFTILNLFQTARNEREQLSSVKNIANKNRESDYEQDKQTGDQEGAEIALFETYSNAMRYILEGMFGLDYENEIQKSNGTNNLPLCSANDQMIDKGCNVMMYSCTTHFKNKYLCYFYYWSFCQCSRPWSIRFLNYIIPPAYDCYPSIATDEDFFQNQEFIDDFKGTKIKKESKLLKTLPDDMEIPVGRCGLNFIFVAWTIVALVTVIWILYRSYLFLCYMKANIRASRKNR
ncbi:hypothetical protein FG386_002173 [Cryptosporidium ryanae]|uniref:uncharacterized protein n=1 Tax=Cryptosporidium ryanae TaxID=515981 RepID=UPI00351A28AD|nr:hypothetical protein FG386_002173 [Cryptosporidium ryanae]